MARPLARRRQRGIATNEIGIVAALLLVGGLIVVGYREHRHDKTLGCLALLAAAADGRLPAGATCPVSDAPFVVEKKGGRETAGCSGRHLPHPPRYVRDEGGAWRLEQDLPAAATVPQEFVHGATTLQVSGGGTVSWVVMKPRFWWRWLVGPIVQILGLLYFLAFAVQVSSRKEDRTPVSVLFLSLLAAVGFGWGAWVSIPTVEGSEAFEFDSPRRRVVHHRYLFGVERAPRTYEACDGVAWAADSLLLVHRTPEGRRLTVLDPAVPDVPLVSWLRSRF